VSFCFLACAISVMLNGNTMQSDEGRVPQRGAIVNCASLNSQMSIAGSVAYTTSKHAVMGITKTVFGPLPLSSPCY